MGLEVAHKNLFKRTDVSTMLILLNMSSLFLSLFFTVTKQINQFLQSQKHVAAKHSLRELEKRTNYNYILWLQEQKKAQVQF